MMHEMAVCLGKIVGLWVFVLAGILIGGASLLVGVAFRNDASPAIAAWLPSRAMLAQALEAETDFARTCPGQQSVIAFWGWSPTASFAPAPFEEDYPTSTRSNPIDHIIAQSMTKGSGAMRKIWAQLDPWLRLVWIRALGAAAVGVAVLFPAFALWFGGRRRAYALQQDSKTPSDRERLMWARGVWIVAVVVGVLIGAPFPAAMGPGIVAAILVALITLYHLRACMGARI